MNGFNQNFIKIFFSGKKVHTKHLIIIGDEEELMPRKQELLIQKIQNHTTNMRCFELLRKFGNRNCGA